MQILFQKQRVELLQFLPHIKGRLKEWLFVEIKLTDKTEPGFTSTDAALLVLPMFEKREGTIYVCNQRELLMVVHIPDPPPPTAINKKIQDRMPPGSCEVETTEMSVEGLTKLEIIMTYKKPVIGSSFKEMRKKRKPNIVLVADDDMYIRTLFRKGLGTNVNVHEVADGAKVLEGYIAQIPDLLFLDIHLPNVDGNELLRNILSIDPEAFIVMVSADSSAENVRYASQNGAKGFLAKPFTKEKLMAYIQNCPTIK